MQNKIFCPDIIGAFGFKIEALIEDLSDDIFKNKKLQNLLGMSDDDAKANNHNYGKIEYHFAKMLAGHPEEIARAKNFIKEINIRASETSLNILCLNGVHPIGLMALRMASKNVHEIVVPGGANANKHIDIFVDDSNKQTKFGFALNLSKEIYWADWGEPSITIGKKITLPESITAAAKGLPLRTIIEHPAFNDTIVIKSIDNRIDEEPQIYFEHNKGMKDVDWILSQDYGSMSWGDDLDQRFMVLDYISKHPVSSEGLREIAEKIETAQNP